MQRCRNQNKMSRWEAELTTHFMHEYEIRDCLWNQNSPYFKNRDVRRMAYKAIADAMNLPNFGVTEVKNKIKNLRSTYGQESKKIVHRQSRGKLYIPTIPWFEQMRRIVENNVDSTTDQNKWLVKEEIDVSDDIVNEDYSIDINNLDLVEQTTCDNTDDIVAKRSRIDNDHLPAITSTSTTSSAGLEDEFHYFGINVASQLREMTLDQALQAQVKIITMLAELRMSKT